MTSRPQTGPGRPLRRQWGPGLRSLRRFFKEPGDLGNSFEAMFALAGPTVEKEFDRFAAHPVGRKLLAQSPRSDLNALLLDREALAAMPKGSFADAYLQYMGGEDMGTPDYFLEAADLDEKAQRFGWSDDQLWFVKRMANSHDLFHVIGGYDRTILGEVGVNAYTAGQIPLLPLRAIFVYLLTLKPSEPLAWYRYVRDSYRHGKRTPSLACVDYEAMLPLPLDEARRQIQAPSFEEAHPHGVPSKGSWLQRLEGVVEGG